MHFVQMFASAPFDVLCPGALQISSSSSSSSKAVDDYTPLELLDISNHMKQGRVYERAMKRTIKQAESCLDTLLPLFQQFYNMLDEMEKSMKCFVDGASSLVAGSSAAKSSFEELTSLCNQAKG
jgi:hypothetical protein